MDKGKTTIQNIHRKTTDRLTRTSLKNGGEFRCSGRVSNFRKLWLKKRTVYVFKLFLLDEAHNIIVLSGMEVVRGLLYNYM